jgi:hypothetical protein
LGFASGVYGSFCFPDFEQILTWVVLIALGSLFCSDFELEMENKTTFS